MMVAVWQKAEKHELAESLIVDGLPMQEMRRLLTKIDWWLTARDMKQVERRGSYMEMRKKKSSEAKNTTKTSTSLRC